MVCQAAEVMCHSESHGDVEGESEMLGESERHCQRESEGGHELGIGMMNKGIEFGAAMFVFFGRLWNRRILLAQFSQLQHCVMHVALISRLKLVLHSSCLCGGVYFSLS